MRSFGPVRGRNLPAYLVLLRVGFTLPPALLPARCALTAPFHPYRNAPKGTKRRYRLCGTGRRCILKHSSRALPGTLPIGVRTFLPRLHQSSQRRSFSPPAAISIPGLVLQQESRHTSERNGICIHGHRSDHDQLHHLFACVHPGGGHLAILSNFPKSERSGQRSRRGVASPTQLRSQRKGSTD